MMQGWTCESHLWIILIGHSDIVEVIRSVNLFNEVFTQFGGSGDVGDSCKLGDSGKFWVILRNLVILGILVNFVDLVILATPVASCDSRISVESGEYGDSVEF